MIQLYIDMVMDVLAGGGVFLLVMSWFTAYIYIMYVMNNKSTVSGNTLVQNLIVRKYQK